MNFRWHCLPAILLLSVIFCSYESFAQRKRTKQNTLYDVDSLENPIPFVRKGWHDKIDFAQHQADLSDGKLDKSIQYIGDSVSTKLFNQAILKDVDHLEVMIENLQYKERPDDEGREKILYLRLLGELLKKFNTESKRDPVYWKRTVTAFKELVIAGQEDRLLSYVMVHPDIYTLANISLLEGNKEAKEYFYTEIARRNPEMMIKRLGEYYKEPFACEVIAIAAETIPNEIYSYASSTNAVLSSAVRNCNDSLTKTIVKITDESKSPLRALPFLSDVYKGRKTITEIDSITKNQDLFYQNLVQLKLEGETMAGSTYTQELQFRGLKYVREINDLHEEKEEVRFDCIKNMTPEQLYFIMVYGQDEIYTSSFIGCFKRMMMKMTADTFNGTQLFQRVHYDKFRTFIRMCAGYNTLGSFLLNMPEEQRTALMKDFISNLDKGDDNDLEDAVDVADAFGSIEDKALVSFLKKETVNNYELAYKNKSMKGMKIYALLISLFNGMKSSDNIAALKAQSEVLQLPPINLVPFKNLQDDSGRVFSEFFFYGDEDGKSSYENFLGDFKNGKWKKTENQYWATFTSTTGKPVTIFASLPLAEPDDEEAQLKLTNYLIEHKIQPAIIVHRGHSYHLVSTLEQLQEHTRIVVLGSCGGYHNLGAVLDMSPDAHIISTKQTGTMLINDVIVQAINSRLLEGRDIEWIELWKEIGNTIDEKIPQSKGTFLDYVPPHKNLGAIFIKAYRRLSASNETEE